MLSNTSLILGAQVHVSNGRGPNLSAEGTGLQSSYCLRHPSHSLSDSPYKFVQVVVMDPIRYYQDPRSERFQPAQRLPLS